MLYVGAVPVSDILLRGRIGAADVARLSAETMVDGCRSPRDAETLVALDRGTTGSDPGNGPCNHPSWAPYLAATVTEYVVRASAPEGYVSAANAAWLAALVAPGGRVVTKAGFEVLVSVIEAARWVPLSLAALALDQIRLAVVEGGGPLRAATAAPAGTIAVAEIESLRRILYGFASDGHVALTQTEIAILAAVDDALAQGAATATGEGTPDAEWTDLYVKAMLNAAFTISGEAVVSRECALARSVPVAEGDRPLHPAALRAALSATGLGGIAGVYMPLSVEERALARLERQRVEIITSERIADVDAEWLAARLSRGSDASFGTTILIDRLAALRDRLAPLLAEAVAAVRPAAAAGSAAVAA